MQLVPGEQLAGKPMHLHGGKEAEHTENNGEQHLQHGDGGHIHGNAHAAEHMAHSQQHPEGEAVAIAGAAHGFLAGNHPGCFFAQGGVAGAATVDDRLLFEQGIKHPDFKQAALISHIHLLAQENSGAYGLDNQITHLRPGQHHHAQVAACHGRPAAQLTGADALGGHGGAGTVRGQGTQEKKPIHQRQTQENAHGNQFRVAGALVYADGGEHLPGDGQGHAHRLVVVEGDGAGAGNHVAADGQIQACLEAHLLIGNDMKRLMNMNLDDLIEDVKSDTDSISIDDLLNPDEDLKNAEAKAQAQALEEAQTEKGKTDLKENKETVKVDESKIKPEKPQKDNFFKKIKKVFFFFF